MRKLTAYHCCAICNTPYGIAHTDGTVTTDADPFDGEVFMQTIRDCIALRVKNNLLNEFQVSPEDLTIISLTVLGEKDA